METILREQQMEATEVVVKEKEYMEYINDHIANVQLAFKNLFLDKYGYLETTSITNEEMRAAIDSIKDAVANHDASKMDDIEFYGYRCKYYPTSEEERRMREDPIYADEITNKYDKAWEHHFMVNDHHPKYWKVIDGQFQKDNPPRDMTLGAIIHTICDWQAMSYHFKNNILDWYEKEADDEKSYMTDTSRKLLEEILYTVCTR